MKITDHLEKLPYFYAAAKHGSFKQAAQSVAISQPSLTKSMNLLEEAIEKQLFIRLPRGVQLTHEGQILKSFCEQLFHSIDNLEQKLTFADEPMAGTLRVGTYESIGIYFWPKFLKKFLPRFPELKIEMKTGRSAEMQRLLESGDLDLILVVEPRASALLDTEIYASDSFQFYQSPNIKSVYKTTQKPPIICMPDAIAGELSVEKLLLSHGITGHQVFTTSSLESVLEFTLNGIGIGLLPEFVARASLEKKKLKKMKLKGLPKEGLGKHNIGVSYLKSQSSSPIIKTLTQHLRNSSWS